MEREGKEERNALAPVGPAGNRFDNESATGTLPVLNIFSSSASCSNLSKSACSSSSSIGSVIGIDVIALPISCVSSCCSRSCSLRKKKSCEIRLHLLCLNSGGGEACGRGNGRRGDAEVVKGEKHTHGNINILHRHFSVNLLHC